MTRRLHLIRPLNSIEKSGIFIVLILPLLASAYTLFSGMLWHLSSFSWAVFIVAFLLTTLGITIGYHRLTTHDSFQTPKAIKYGLLVLGCMTFQGPVLFWVAVHRRHHKYSDQLGDPHSPRLAKNWLKNFIHAQSGWLFSHQLEDWDYYASDLRKDKGVLFIHRYYLVFALFGLLLPGIINGLYFMSSYQFFVGVMVGGFLRIMISQNLTWGVNSVCHLWGRRDFSAADNSRNNSLMGILALGDGWHNGHHAFPRSARHGLLWWQFDFSYCVIRLLGLLGLAKNISQPSRATIQKLRLHDKS